MRPVSGGSVSLERVAAFAAVGAAFGLGYPKHGSGVLILPIGIVSCLGVAQNNVPGRRGRLSDGLAKASGALLGVAFSMLAARHRRVP